MRLQVTDIRTLTDEQPNIRYFEFRSGAITVGSHSNNLLQLPDIELAAHYATIERVGDKWMLRPTTRDDGLSTVNEQSVRGELELKNGDVLQITRFEIRVEIEPEGADVVVTQPGKAGELALIKQYPVPPRTVVRKPAETIKLAAPRQRALAKLAISLADCGTLPALMECALKALESEFEARMVWMGVRRKVTDELEFMDGRFEGATSMAEPPNLPTFVYRCLSRNQHLAIPRTGDGVTQSVLAVPILRGEDAMGLVYVDTKRHARVFDDSDLDFITMIAGLVQAMLDRVLQAPVAMETVGRENASSRAAAVAPTEGSLVHDLRARVHPQKLPQWSTLELAHFSARGTERSGDILDTTRMPNGLVAIILGRLKADANRTLMALAEIRGAFRIAGLHADAPRMQMRALNWLLSDKEDPCSCEAAIVVINPKTGAFEISTAGSIGAALIGHGAKAKPLRLPDAPSVGNGQTIEYKSGAGKIGDKETLALFTPGTIDATDDQGTKLGEKRLIEAMTDGFGQSASKALSELTADLAAYLKKPAPADDITILLAHRPGEG
jgi:pSer/pThr/pTyr-binding forkhead associated (FHA) protein